MKTAQESIFSRTLAFNTGRHYSAAGQRIAAGQLANGCIFMLDIDRGVDYLLAEGTPFTPAGVMESYDSASRHNTRFYEALDDWQEVTRGLNELHNLANALGSL